MGQWVSEGRLRGIPATGLQRATWAQYRTSVKVLLPIIHLLLLLFDLVVDLSPTSRLCSDMNSGPPLKRGSECSTRKYRYSG